MKVQLRIRLRRTGILGVVFVATLVAVGTFVGCRALYGGASGGGSTSNDFLATGQTLSFFTAVQVDPQSEDSAGPQFVVAEDLDNDGYLDLVSAWNQSQPVQIHLQRRSATGDISFETVTLAGNIPVVRVAGLGVADFDMDGAPDIAVLVKQSGLADAGCLEAESPAEGGYAGVVIVYLAPAAAAETNQALAWRETPIGASLLAGLTKANPGPPEEEGYTSMVLGDLDMDGAVDLVVAWIGACGGDPEVLTFTNGGPGAVRDGTWSVSAIADPFPKGPLVQDEEGLDPVRVKDVALGDVDNDGDPDVIATYPDAGSLNIRWYRNPVVDIADDYHVSIAEWQTGVVGQVSPKAEFEDLGGADIIRVGDVDRDGLLDVVVRSSGGRVIQWLKGPGFQATTAPLPNIPWRVYTLAEFTERTPEGLAVGDLNLDGQPEVIVSASGGLLFLDAQAAPSVYDQWTEQLIVDDIAPGQPGDSPATTDPNVTSAEIAGTTFINSILVVDLDGDGANDLVATFDRSGLSGLSNDALVWFRNTR
jgi:hypothetical protein